MLSHEEKSALTEELDRYEIKSAVCIEALRVVQSHRGWISDEAIRDIAEFLEMSPAEVDGVATFYNLIFRKPVGKNVVFVCDSVSCWVMGCDALKEHLKNSLGVDLGQTSPDGEFTILPIACLGCCEAAPVLLAEGEPVTRVDLRKIDELLDRLRKRPGAAA